MKKRHQGFNTAAQDSNPGSRSRESEALPLSHCALQKTHPCISLIRSWLSSQISDERDAEGRVYQAAKIVRGRMTGNGFLMG